MFKQLSSCGRLIHQMNCYHISPALNSSIQLYQHSLALAQSQAAVGAGGVRNQLSSSITTKNHRCIHTNPIVDGTYSSTQTHLFSTSRIAPTQPTLSAVCCPTSLCTRSTTQLPTFNQQQQQQQWNHRPHRSFTTNTATMASKPPSPVTPMKPRTVTEANAAASGTAAATPNPHFQRQERLEAAARQRAQAAASSSSNPFRSQSTADATAAAVQQQQKVAFDAFKVRSQRDLTISQYLFFSVVAIVSLLGGASIVHNIYKPDLTLPDIKPKHLTTGATTTDKQSTNPPSTPSTKQQ